MFVHREIQKKSNTISQILEKKLHVFFCHKHVETGLNSAVQNKRTINCISIETEKKAKNIFYQITSIFVK